MKIFRLIAVAAVVAFGFAPKASAFHDGGVAYCEGCHTMHNSLESKSPMRRGLGTPGSTVLGTANAYLLQGTDDSSTCLNCHAATDTVANFTGSYHVMTFPAPAVGTAPSERTPGGDFAWLTQTFTGYSGAPPGQPGSRAFTGKGERHGHNIVAADYGLVADKANLTGPGGTYQGKDLSCASCHDPHSRARIVDANGTIAYPKLGTAVLPIGASGSYGAVPDANEAVGVYRLLAGKNYVQMSVNDANLSVTPFVNDPPVAVAPAVYNRTEALTETRVAYGQGMSEWCANCHSGIHNDAYPTNVRHPAGNLAKLTGTANNLVGAPDGTTIATIYNAYKKSGDLTGTPATSYTSLVPYEEGTGVIATLAAHAVSDGTQTAGPTTGKENVMCLTCHRAHAGGFDSMTRWNNRGEFITEGGVYPNNAGSASQSGGMTAIELAGAYYDRPAGNFAYAQRSLCNKCHAKD